MSDDATRTGSFSMWCASLNMRSKFLLIIVPLIVTSLAVCGCVGMRSVYKSVDGALDLGLSETAIIAGKRVTSYLEVDRQLTMEIAQWTSMLDKNAVSMTMLEDIAERDKFVQVGLLDRNGHSTRGIDHSGKNYFQAVKGKTSYESFMSPIQYDDAVRSFVIAFSAPIVRDGVFDGAVLCILDAAILSDLVRDLAIGESGAAFIIDKDQMCVAHTDKKQVFFTRKNLDEQIASNPKYRPLASMWDEMSAGHSGYYTYDYVSGRRIAAYAPIPNTPGWSVAITVNRDDFFAPAESAAVTTAVLSVLCLIVVIIVTYRVINGMAKRMERVTVRIEQLAEGDLSSPVADKSCNDEIGRLTEATGRLVTELSLIVGEIRDILKGAAEGNLDVIPQCRYVGDFAEISQALVKNSIGLGAMLGRISRAAEEVARGSAQMAAGASELSQGATEQASSVEELFATISEVARRASEIAAPANERDTDIEGDDDFNLTPEQRTERRDAAAKTMTERLIIAMERVTETSVQINKIANMIECISSETYILALNASVEAAHAGEAGKGFGVIAGEVRQLAGKSREAVGAANARMEEIQYAVERGGKMVALTVDATSAIVVSLDQIKSALSQISSVIESTAATAEEIAASSEELSAQADLLRENVTMFKYREN